MRTLYSLVFLASLAGPAAASLSPGDMAPPLTPDEQSRYQSLPSDAAQDFLATRDYVRKARAVTSGSLNPSSFPDQPSNYRESYLFDGDAGAINQAIFLSLKSMSSVLWKPTRR